MIRLTKAQVIYLHKLLINESGGSHGIRDEGILVSSLNAHLKLKTMNIYINPFI